MRWTQALGRLAYWTLPAGVFEATQSFMWKRGVATGGLTRAERLILDRNLELRDRHTGERCFILATGPSIKTQDLKRLAGETCIAVSNFFVHPDYAAIHPQYYCVAPHHPPITEEAWDAWLAEMAQATPGTEMFFGLTDWDRSRRRPWFQDRPVRYVAFGGTLAELALRGADLRTRLPSPQSVSMMALCIALYMGFKDIYLLGCDHDWILHLRESRHFYNEREHAMQRKGYNEWEGASIENSCRCYVELWEQYRALKVLASARGTRISNATQGGILDVFPRVHLDDLF